MTQMADNNRVAFLVTTARQSIFLSQTSEILAAEKTTSSHVSADFTLICDHQHDKTGSLSYGSFIDPSDAAQRKRKLLWANKMFLMRKNARLGHSRLRPL